MHATRLSGTTTVGSTICYSVTGVIGNLTVTGSKGLVNVSVEPDGSGGWIVCCQLRQLGEQSLYLSSTGGQNMSLGFRTR